MWNIKCNSSGCLVTLQTLNVLCDFFNSEINFRLFHGQFSGVKGQRSQTHLRLLKNQSTVNINWSGSHPDQQLHDDCVSLGGGHVQRRPVNFGAGVSADAGPQQHVGGGVMTVLSGQVEGGRPQLQDTHRYIFIYIIYI